MNAITCNEMKEQQMRSCCIDDHGNPTRDVKSLSNVFLTQPQISNSVIDSQEIQDISVPYDAATNFQLIDDSEFDLIPLRRKDILSLKALHNSLGPFPTYLYLNVLLRELSCAEGDGESEDNFRAMKDFLKSASDDCINQCDTYGNEGRSNKLIKLEEIVLSHVQQNDNRRGIIFVGTRVVAIALHCYLDYRYSSENADIRIRSSFLVRR